MIICTPLFLELSVGLQTEGVDVRSVGNSQVCNNNTHNIKYTHII